MLSKEGLLCPPKISFSLCDIACAVDRLLALWSSSLGFLALVLDLPCAEPAANPPQPVSPLSLGLIHVAQILLPQKTNVFHLPTRF